MTKKQLRRKEGQKKSKRQKGAAVPLEERQSEKPNKFLGSRLHDSFVNVLTDLVLNGDANLKETAGDALLLFVERGVALSNPFAKGANVRGELLLAMTILCL